MTKQKEFGDFQTPLALAEDVVALIDRLIGRPDRVIEPTAGLGSFLEAAQLKWLNGATYEGYELNPAYVADVNDRMGTRGINLLERDFFEADWRSILGSSGEERLLVLGNPPWVTNAALSTFGSSNVPRKANFQGLKGFDAKTGKSNFDIAEWIIIRLIEALPSYGTVAMLCKTMTARKVLSHFWKSCSRLPA